MRPKTLLLSIIIAFLTMFLFAYLKDSPEDVKKVVEKIEKTTPKKINSYLTNTEKCNFTLDLLVKKLDIATNYNSDCPKDYIKDLVSLSKSNTYFLYFDRANGFSKDQVGIPNLPSNNFVLKVFSVENKDLVPYQLKIFEPEIDESLEVIKLAVLDNDYGAVLYKTSSSKKMKGSENLLPKYYLLVFNLPDIYKFNPFNVDSMYNIQTQNDQLKLYQLDGIETYKLVKFEGSKVKFEDSKGVNLKEIDLTNGL